MKDRTIFIEPNTTAEIGIPYKEGYIIHVNAGSGVVSMYKVNENKKEHIVTHLLAFEEPKREIKV